ncbi:MAG TPA: hypothetical protein VFA44_15710 [Gaiellaceae bacterium]|nr:hypothetical protein [Gaiellaceae bacterium]
MSQPRFDPYAILQELERVRCGFVVIGGLARVIQGSDELTHGLDIAPSMNKESLRRLGQALENLNARRVDRQPLALDQLDPQREPVIELTSDAGEIKIVPEPAGTRGYEDLRFRANHEPLGHGLRPSVASPGDLVRMLEAHDRQPDPLVLETMRTVLELEHRLTIWRLEQHVHSFFLRVLLHLIDADK